MKQFRKLKANEIECRVGVLNANGASILLYKNARTDMDLLDEVVGAENWESDYKEIKGNLYAGIGVKFDGNMIWKWDCGVESRTDEAGNEKKGEASDAFKRAGVKWGIGRELYTAPFIWIPANKMNLEEKKGKLVSKDTFSVSQIDYTDSRISKLELVNQKGQTVYVMGQKTIADIEEFCTCDMCHSKITPVMKRDGTAWGVKDMVAFSKKKYGKALCAKCMKEVENA